MIDRIESAVDPIALAEMVAVTLASEGAEAVVLMGSQVRGDAQRDSDVDVVAIGNGEPYRLERRAGWLVSTSWVTPEQVREQFASPSDAPGVVAGWRLARILLDPSRVAADFQRSAREWSWDVVGEDACNLYVSEEITGLAEEVHKLVHLRATGNLTGAAVQRSILAFRLAVVLAIHLRLIVETENVLWNAVNERLGERWTEAQLGALGLGGESFDETCRAALELYRLAADEVRPLLDDRQLRVVDHACGLIHRSDW